jgi:hypothetical protein
MRMTTYFCDGIKQVTLINGVARVEFFRLQNANPSRVEPPAEAAVELTLAVPAAGLVQMISALERLRDQLIEKGFLQPTGNGTSPAPSEPDFSPNFPRQTDTPGQA